RWDNALAGHGGYAKCVTRGQEGQEIECRIVLDATVGAILPPNVSFSEGDAAARESATPLLRFAATPEQTTGQLLLVEYPEVQLADRGALMDPWGTLLQPTRTWLFGEALRNFEERGGLIGTPAVHPSGRNLLSFIATLQTGHPERWARVLEAVRTI